jgi:acetyltransferase-like isoleucine patch superfamily enzyme
LLDYARGEDRMESLKTLMRLFGMYFPAQSVRVAMYRKAGVRIGKPRYFGTHIHIDVHFSDVTIGDNVLLSGFIRIISHSNVRYGWATNEGDRLPVVIKDGARISMDVNILPGVTIGENSVIGAGSVVNKDIPANCMAAGVPAKVIKYYDPASFDLSKNCVK